MLTRRRLAAMSTGALATAFAAASFARAQPAPKTLRLLVGFALGGSIDTVARLLAENMKGYWETAIVENRPGAGGRLALEALKAAPADGSTIALTPGEQLSLFPHIYRNVTYDVLRDFTPVGTVCTVQFLLVVGPMVPASVTTLDAFIGWCRANPSKATYGTAGAGTRQHFFGQSLARAVHFDFIHVPYRGAQPAMQDLLAGQIAASIAVTSSALAAIRTGQARALVTTAPKRGVSLPELPTIGESGYPALESVEWFGLLAPRDTPATLVATLDTSTREALGTAKVRDTIANLSMEVAPSTPDELARLIRSDSAGWAKIIEASGFKPLD